MTILHALALGLIQGATEFLPISSSGHLVWVPKALGWPAAPPSFDVLVHFGTLLALTVFYRRDLWALVRGCAAWFRRGRGRSDEQGAERSGRRLVWLLLIGTLPAAVVGVALKHPVESLLTSDRIGPVASFFLVSGALAWFVHWRSAPGKRAEAMTVGNAVLTGLAQACALVPGLSRSGSTIALGVACGLDRREAARFAFLLAFPAILGATALDAKELIGLRSTEALSYAVGLVAAVLSGYLAINVVLALLQRHVYYVFAIYCAVLGVALLFWQLSA
jgi:undecaprenyl-diphosphatase